ncbi:hypothetical protein COCMIDRAFT_40532 [Bipolaris oryzae ATCC 44560]|uniref:Uncharacterized protein n=1 Tax=Bipolaris oryzae ATCC 44560 TaxID=930090 RepID=W6ZC24_COCMI|nr:uncharacterized protein COCMIDRAFT_40532 [Bipolaris oryzae ATCC 44560]EUC41276.1 hypothetical protein COCMIDRAFT_40532 [Bipolaris oryzae ATCC 44560]
MQEYACLLSEKKKPFAHDSRIHQGQQQEADQLKDGQVGLLAGEILKEVGFLADKICLGDVAGESDSTYYIYTPFLGKISSKPLSITSESAPCVWRQQPSKPCHKLHAGPNPRTCSSAHTRIARRQRTTDDDQWISEIAAGLGWQLARQINFDALLNGEEYSADHPDLVTDGWTQVARVSLGLIAGPPRVREPVVKDAATAKQPSTYSRFTSCGVKDPPSRMSTYLFPISRMSRLWTRMARLDVLILATGFLLVIVEGVAPVELFGKPVADRGSRHLKDKYGYPDFGASHRMATNNFLGLGGGPGSLNLTVIF